MFCGRKLRVLWDTSQDPALSLGSVSLCYSGLSSSLEKKTEYLSCFQNSFLGLDLTPVKTRLFFCSMLTFPSCYVRVARVEANKTLQISSKIFSKPP